jgi:hypothetical protein
MSVDGNKQVYALVAVKQTQHCSLVGFLRDFVGAACEYFVGSFGSSASQEVRKWRIDFVGMEKRL